VHYGLILHVHRKLACKEWAPICYQRSKSFFKHGVLEVSLVKGSESSYNYCDIFIFETLSLTYDQSQEHETLFEILKVKKHTLQA